MITETTLENKMFDFDKAKVQTLSLAQLERTHRENDVYGKPLRGIYHFELLNNLINECNNLGYNVEVYDLFAAQNKDRSTPGVVLLPQVEAIHGERAFEAHILRRVFANIRITDFDDEEKTTNLAVAFHQKGIQVGFGNMVKICHNQTMLCADKYIATYSERGKGRGEPITIPQVLDVVKSWLVNARQIIISEREKNRAYERDRGRRSASVTSHRYADRNSCQVRFCIPGNQRESRLSAQSGTDNEVHGKSAAEIRRN